MRRFGDQATIAYLDTQREDVRAAHSAMVETIREQGLMYPVTVVDGEPLHYGSVSYAAILRAVTTRLSSLSA